MSDDIEDSGEGTLGVGAEPGLVRFGIAELGLLVWLSPDQAELMARGLADAAAKARALLEHGATAPSGSA
jgi:hypothetical protein